MASLCPWSESSPPSVGNTARRPHPRPSVTSSVFQISDSLSDPDGI